ncbi:MAG: hypothetical protein JXB09_01900 [Deltaproteobacteria bacterium]|nr:hypothetical protein [Deltaproteobacteria bacterium]
MKQSNGILLLGLLCAWLFFMPGDGAWAARTLSKEIAPDVPAQTFDLLDQHAVVFFEGSGQKDLILIADVFCVNSRKTHDLLKKNMEYIRSLKVLLVTRYPQLGSDIVAAHVLRMHASGKGGLSLDSAFNLDITRDGDFKARREALIETFQRDPGEDEKTDTLAELETVRRNTKIAGEVGYSGTPHIIVGKRVLHGYSRAAIKIMLKEDL